MNKHILANQIQVDCTEFEKDVEAGLYKEDLQSGAKRMEQIADKFEQFCHYDEPDPSDLARAERERTYLAELEEKEKLMDFFYK